MKKSDYFLCLFSLSCIHLFITYEGENMRLKNSYHGMVNAYGESKMIQFYILILHKITLCTKYYSTTNINIAQELHITKLYTISLLHHNYTHVTYINLHIYKLHYIQ